MVVLIQFVNYRIDWLIDIVQCLKINSLPQNPFRNRNSINCGSSRNWVGFGGGGGRRGLTIRILFLNKKVLLRPPRSKCSLYCSVQAGGGGGTPSCPGRGGVPHTDLTLGYPILSWPGWGTPSWPGWGYPILNWPEWYLILGYPHPDLTRGTPSWPDQGVPDLG